MEARRPMEPRECFFKNQFGYCWLEKGLWYFRPVDEVEGEIGEPVEVSQQELVFEHEEDEE